MEVLSILGAIFLFVLILVWILTHSSWAKHQGWIFFVGYVAKSGVDSQRHNDIEHSVTQEAPSQAPPDTEQGTPAE